MMIQLPEAEFAVRAVSEAAEVASRVQSALVADAITKEDRSPVTVADFAAQAVVARRLQESLSADTLIGEESADVLRAESGAAALEQIAQFVGEALPGVGSAEICDLIDAGVGDPPNSFWSLDPVDGTKGFLRGDQYAVALALVRDGQVEVGALACPELEEATRPATGGAGSVLAADGDGSAT